MSSFLNPNQEIEKHKDKLPHWQQGDVWVFVTWRLADSLPQTKLLKWKEEKEIWISLHPKPWSDDVAREYARKFTYVMEDWLDAGAGSCTLSHPDNALIVANALRHFNHEWYQLSDFVIMPNHVHVMFRLIDPHKLESIIKTWKQFTATKVNENNGTSGALWQKGYWDRLIRSQEHFDWTQKYIQKNPKHLSSGKYILWSGEQYGVETSSLRLPIEAQPKKAT